MNVQIGARAVPLDMPALLVCNELILAYPIDGKGPKVQRIRQRVMLAALGLSWGGAKPEGWPDYYTSGCDPLVYGEAVYDCLTRAGAPTGDLVVAAKSALDQVFDRFPTSQDRTRARDFFGAPGAATSPSGRDGSGTPSPPKPSPGSSSPSSMSSTA